MIQTLKATKTLLGFESNEVTKISSLQGSVVIWHMANLGIFIVLLLSLCERIISASTIVTRTIFMVMVCVHTSVHKNIQAYYKSSTLK